MLPDAVGCNPAALLTQLHEALGFVPVLGAVAAGAPMFELHNTEAAQGALVGVALSGLAPVIGVAQGCTPIGQPYVITRAEANVIQRIANRPALEVLEDAIRALPDAEARIRRAGVFAGLAMDPAKSPLERGDFLVRNLVGADQSSGALAVAERVRVGQTLQFQIRDAEASREDPAGCSRRWSARLGGRRPAFGCYFDCAGRGRGLFGVPDHDVHADPRAARRVPARRVLRQRRVRADRPAELLPQLHGRPRGLSGGLRALSTGLGGSGLAPPQTPHGPGHERRANGTPPILVWPEHAFVYAATVRGDQLHRSWSSRALLPGSSQAMTIVSLSRIPARARGRRSRQLTVAEGGAVDRRERRRGQPGDAPLARR